MFSREAQNSDYTSFLRWRHETQKLHELLGTRFPQSKHPSAKPLQIKITLATFVDKTVRIWKRNGALIKTLQQKATQYSITFSPDRQISMP